MTERDPVVELAQLTWRELLEEARNLKFQLSAMSQERDLALAAMKRLPEHLKECQGDGTDDDPPCVALLAYEEGLVRESALREALEMALGFCTGSFAEGWTMRVTGHQMNAIRRALAAPPSQEGKEPA